MTAPQPSPDAPAEDPAAPSPEAVESRAHLLPEEEAAGSDDPRRQAEVILEESGERILERADHAEPSERRTSADTVEPIDEG